MQPDRAAAAEPWQQLEAVASWDGVGLPEAALSELRRFAVEGAPPPRAGVTATRRRGTLLLFSGEGDGKKAAAQALAGEVHRPLLEANLVAIFAHGRAEAGRLTARLFADAQRLGAVLLLEHAEPVVGAAAGGGAHARMTPSDVRDLMRRCESYPGFVVFAVTLTRRASPAALARFDAVIQFPAGGDVGTAAVAPVASAEPTALAPPAPAAAAVSPEPAAAPPLEPEIQPEPATEPAPEPAAEAAPEPSPAPTPEPIAAPEPFPAPEPTAAPEPPEPALTPEPAPTPEPPAEPEVAYPRRLGAVSATTTQRAPQPRSPQAPSRPRPRRLAPVAVLGAVAAVVLGLAASEHKTKPATPAATTTLDRSASVGPAHLSYPSQWRARPASALGGLALTNALVLTPTSGAQGSLTVGTAQTPVTTPIPDSLVASAMPGRPAPQLVELGRLPFVRVLDPRLALNSTGESIYALPTSRGTLIAACRTASQTFAATCEKALSSVKLPAGVTTGATPAYGSSLAGVLGTLAAARGRANRQLQGAHDAAGQARAASALSAAHEQAALNLSRLSAGAASPANTALVAALRSASEGYTELSQAATRNNLGAYRQAAGTVMSANRAITAALARLRALGYDVR